MWKLIDTNVWLALVISGHHHHSSVRQWFQAETPEDVLVFCRSTQQSVLRLLTTDAVFKPFGNPPLTNDEARGVYESLLRNERVEFVQEPPGVEGLWLKHCAAESASPKMWMDGYLAAFANAGGYRFVTLDSAFQRYEGLDLLLLGDGGQSDKGA